MRDGRHVILCLDDDTDVLEQLRLILEANDYAMVAAESAESGLKRFRQEDPDLVIVDLMMEELDAGVNFLRELKALGNKAPVFMLSSVGDQLATTFDTADLGLAGVFQKPIQSATLLATLRASLPK